MCGSKPRDDSAEITRKNEEERQARIRAGQGSIDQTFDTTFNDDYFNRLTTDYQDYYNPQLAEQYDNAVKELTFQTARSGNAESTAANELFSKLEKQKKDAATKVTNDALAASGKARSDVASQRSNLYSLNNASADPTQAASQAGQAALALNQPVSYSPMGEIFASLINNVGNAAAINKATSAPSYGGTAPKAPSYSDTSSGYVAKG
jgi:hypothetical protein